MSISIQRILSITRGKLLEKGADTPIQHLLTDSRQVFFARTALFFAIRGLRQDGHDFIRQAYEEGVRNFIISQKTDTTPFENANVILVENTVQALQDIARYHREQFAIPIVAITGSNGKTIVKEWLFQLLHDDVRIVRSPKSYNSQIGVPLSLWQINQHHHLGIFEAGISQQGEMKRLTPLIRPQIGIFTNIGSAHSAGFPSMEEKVAEKLSLFEQVEKLIYCRDYELIDEQVKLKLSAKQIFSWSTQHPADLRILERRTVGNQTQIQAVFRGKELQIQIPFSDQASIENAIHCWAFMLLRGYPNEQIAERMLQLEPVAMRLELRPGIQNCTIINDAYNSDLNALRIALEFLQQQANHPHKIVVLSDILQMGEPREEFYPKVAGLLSESSITAFVGVGRECREIGRDLPASIEQHFFDTTDQYLSYLHEHLPENSSILLKGARKFAFERIADRLALKTHRTTLEINLHALRHNINVYHRYLQPGVKLLVMVKASAYGSGALEVARLLEFQQIDYLSVAYIDEGIELRKAGIQLPILVLNPDEAELDALVRFHLEPELYSLEQIETLIRYLPEDARPFPVHIKLETGMNRLGFTEEELPRLCHLLQTYQTQLKVASAFSHLAASESAGEDAFSLQQIERFTSMYEQIADKLGYRPWRHLLNSAGILRFPEHQMDMVRLGIGVYGIDSTNLIQKELEPVLVLKAAISKIKELPAGSTVGYGRKGRLEKKSRIATLSVGYADGLLRLAGNQRYEVSIRGQRAPLIGNICMDMCMADVSHLPEASAGDEVIVFGQTPSVQELATALQTIPYEVFTNISHRVRRVYVQE
jgi:alanine racemase